MHNRKLQLDKLKRCIADENEPSRRLRPGSLKAALKDPNEGFLSRKKNDSYKAVRRAVADILNGMGKIKWATQ